MSVCSMTGFGQHLEELPEGRLSVEVRTLNARGRELAIHTGGLGVPEAALRELAAARFTRGKIDVTVRLEPREGAGTDAVTGLVDDLRAHIAGRDILLHEALLARLILAMEGAGGRRRGADPDPDRVLAAATAACERALEHRRQEGARMAQAISEVAKRLAGQVARIETLAPAHAQTLRDRLTARLADAQVPSGVLAEPSLAREIALLADRADVNEELARIRTHLSRLDDTLTSGRPMGRELDFLCQELVRESNTVGSKSSETGITAAVIQLKTGIEQIRELAANLE
jgi:uncharacterized protein (TIGR00255 family)